jgi:hypothetical protein
MSNIEKKSNIIHNRLIDRNSEEKQLIVMTNQITPVLKEIMDNEKDEIYDDL